MSKAHLYVATMLFIVAAPAVGDTIVSEFGPNGFGTSIIIGQLFGAFSWAQTSDYGNVAISADFSVVAGTELPSGNAFLTTQIGPGTNSSDVVASTTFTFPAVEGPVTLFSSLSLPANTYYLVIGVTDGYGGIFYGSASPTVVLGPGVSGPTSYGANTISGLDYSFNPASSFSAFGALGGWDAQVTGDPTPEPSNIIVCSISMLLMVWVFQKRSKRPEH